MLFKGSINISYYYFSHRQERACHVVMFFSCYSSFSPNVENTGGTEGHAELFALHPSGEALIIILKGILEGHLGLEGGGGLQHTICGRSPGPTPVNKHRHRLPFTVGVYKSMSLPTLLNLEGHHSCNKTAAQQGIDTIISNCNHI